jgi:hypothetical protein
VVARNIYRILPGGAGWSLSGPNLTTSFKTKEEAERYGTDLALRNQPSQLMIHLANGQFEKEYTYGDDPERTPG